MTTDQSCVDVLPRTRLNKWDNLRFTFEFRQLLHMRKTAYHSFESILPTRTLDLKALLTFYDATFHQQPISEADSNQIRPLSWAILLPSFLCRMISNQFSLFIRFGCFITAGATYSMNCLYLLDLLAWIRTSNETSGCL